jgi:hypothetical protein
MALISVGKNGTDGGMVKTRGRMAVIDFVVVIPANAGIHNTCQSKACLICGYGSPRSPGRRLGDA